MIGLAGAALRSPGASSLDSTAAALGVMLMKHVWLMSCALALLAGCGDSEKPPIVVGRDRKDAGDNEDRDAGPSRQRGPMIEFMTPTAAEGPSDEAVLTDRTVKVRCQITRRDGGRPVNPDTVDISMDKPAMGDMVEKVRPPVSHVSDDEYEATFDLGDMPNGPVRFTCLAKDNANTPQTNSQSLVTLLDLGPKIEVKTPENRKTYALTRPVSVEFQVAPAPLGEGDDGAEIAEIKLQVSGLDFPFTEDEETKGLYRASIDFNDQSLFAVAPSSAEVLVAAKNKRSPTPATRSVKLDIVLDGSGPAITVMSPSYGSIVHGEITFRVTAADPAGVAPGTLKAVFEGVKDGEDYVISDWKPGPAGTLEQLVDTVAFDDYLNQVTIQVTAVDGVNNISTVPHLLRLDNVPPRLSMDPPLWREWKKAESKYYCSDGFDPLGEDAANDLKVVDPSVMFRVLVEDETNRSKGDFAPAYAGVDTNKVELFAQGDPNTPLLIDKDGDGTCDEINSDPATNKPTKLRLTALTPRGGAWYPKDSTTPPVNLLTETGIVECGRDPNGPLLSAGTPAKFCQNTLMYRVVYGAAEDKPPAVYALNPKNNDKLNCQGEAWMILPVVGPGWACLATRAEDRIGNVGISRPLRVCVRPADPLAPAPCEDNGPDAPTCLGSCTIDRLPGYGSELRKAP